MSFLYIFIIISLILTVHQLYSICSKWSYSSKISTDLFLRVRRDTRNRFWGNKLVFCILICHIFLVNAHRCAEAAMLVPNNIAEQHLFYADPVLGETFIKMRRLRFQPRHSIAFQFINEQNFVTSLEIIVFFVCKM
jgi:hypothetical protein